MLYVHKRDASFERPKHMFKLMGKTFIAILHSKICLIFFLLNICFKCMFMVLNIILKSKINIS